MISGFATEKKIEEAKRKVDDEAKKVINRKVDDYLAKIADGHIPEGIIASCPYCHQRQERSYRESRFFNNILPAIPTLLFGLAVVILLMRRYVMAICAFAATAISFILIILLSRKQKNKSENSMATLSKLDMPLAARTLDELSILTAERFITGTDKNDRKEVNLSTDYIGEEFHHADQLDDTPITHTVSRQGQSERNKGEAAYIPRH